MRDDGDHYEQVGINSVADIERPLNQSGGDIGLLEGRDAAVLDKPRRFVLDLGSRQGKKVWCHVV
jgi:hypothetical protein